MIVSHKTFLRAICVASLLCLVSSSALEAALPDSIKPVRNIILMIPDGTSPSTVSLARWYQRYVDPSQKHLAIDPYISGMVLTYSSNAPIGDSAPTTSCYMTGMPSISGFISTYPFSCGVDDLIPVDDDRAYTPIATLLEAGRIRLGKKTGLVFTCEFPHATPADCSAHTSSRKRYDVIVPQMVHQGLDVVIGGGVSLLPSRLQEELEARGYDVLLNDFNALRDSKAGKIWALFADRDMPYDIDRDTAFIPSLAQATAIAIDRLRKEDSEGFFLMVEGSKIDWAAHANDPVGITTEYLAFDRACRVALDFARHDEQTAVIIVSDHGNSGVSIGKQNLKDYDRQPASALFATLTRIRLTADAMAERVRGTVPERLDSLFSAVCGFVPTNEEREHIYHSPDYLLSPIPQNERSVSGQSSLYSGGLSNLIARIYTNHMPIGFTTQGHTGETVLLSVYHPNGTEPRGMITNIELADYMAKLWGMHAPFDSLTDSIFARHSQVFAGLNSEVQPALRSLTELRKVKGYKDLDLSDYHPRLVIKEKCRVLEIIPYRDYVLFDGKRVNLGSVIVYEEKTNSFYLPQSLRDLVD